MAPISIDGTDITGATIDGQDVQEITVDGDTVFTAGSLPVAYSNLVAWYPFDSSFYGGSNGDDVTALFNSAQSGDSTAYDGTVNGATYQSSGGVTDINAGPNSGAFDFNGSTDSIDTGINNSVLSSPFTISAWFNPDSTGGLNAIVSNRLDPTPTPHFIIRVNSGVIEVNMINGGENVMSGPSVSTGTQNFVAFSHDGSTGRLYVNAGTAPEDTKAFSSDPFNNNVDAFIGRRPEGTNQSFDGKIDDVRFYNAELSGTQINEIYNNTEP